MVEVAGASWRSRIRTSPTAHEEPRGRRATTAGSAPSRSGGGGTGPIGTGAPIAPRRVPARWRGPLDAGAEPLERHVIAVLDGVRRGEGTRDAAPTDYGVVITGPGEAPFVDRGAAGRGVSWCSAPRGGYLRAAEARREPARRRQYRPDGRREGWARMPRPIEVHKVAIESVTDGSGLARLIDDGVFSADDVLAVIGKTEGNGGVNDYTRILADRAFREVLVAKGGRSAAEVGEVPLVWSGGTDGVLSPHATVFAYAPRDRYPATDELRVTVGVAMSREILPEDIGRPEMVRKVAEGVRVAMERAGITDPADVHYVQTKTPLLVLDTINEAKARGRDVVTEDTLKSMDISNSTTALGIAVALGEIEEPRAEQIHTDLSLYSSVASCSSGVELDRAQIVVVGNARGIGGRFRAGHGVMRDALDADGVWSAIRSAGLELPERPHPDDLKGRLVNVFLKCEADPGGRVRGRRNIMLDDSDVHWHRQIKAAVGGVAAAVTGDPAVFVSVAAVHQGPPGGGPVAAVVDLGE
ncbi:hypothetical protein GCM10027294_00400 [Marinactinospora endophytica]